MLLRKRTDQDMATRIVAPKVAGSSPVGHPLKAPANNKKVDLQRLYGAPRSTLIVHQRILQGARSGDDPDVTVCNRLRGETGKALMRRKWIGNFDTDQLLQMIEQRTLRDPATGAVSFA